MGWFYLSQEIIRSLSCILDLDYYLIERCTADFPNIELSTIVGTS